jgi:hypothetical protein
MTTNVLVREVEREAIGADRAIKAYSLRVRWRASSRRIQRPSLYSASHVDFAFGRRARAARSRCSHRPVLQRHGLRGKPCWTISEAMDASSLAGLTDSLIENGWAIFPGAFIRVEKGWHSTHYWFNLI